MSKWKSFKELKRDTKGERTNILNQFYTHGYHSGYEQGFVEGKRQHAKQAAQTANKPLYGSALAAALITGQLHEFAYDVYKVSGSTALASYPVYQLEYDYAEWLKRQPIQADDEIEPPKDLHYELERLVAEYGDGHVISALHAMFPDRIIVINEQQISEVGPINLC